MNTQDTLVEMILIPAGTARIGSEKGKPDEAPLFEIEMEAFCLDRHPVTNKQFAYFVKQSGFITDAEKFGNASVLDEKTGYWHLIQGANWQYPLGPDKTSAKADHPVTQVSWQDAHDYCAFYGKVLPSEIQWEYAARNARKESPEYGFGDSILKKGMYLANVWQGQFPVKNSGEDGYRYTSPVGVFGTTPLGLTDMIGNVWEWTQDWYRSYSDRDRPFNAARDTQKVMRGGSFLCEPHVCHGFRVSARSAATPDTSLMHVGFRCAFQGIQDRPAWIKRDTKQR
ncbi:MAG: formylglycine-generating enzyme family protein [Methylococcales bacterium]